ncbi:MAG: hypothetical protein E7812_05030 [Phenylobacterium sp.]|nr:MAG: hypothetical protein E7812_05030 [Phenylobacterium sp.]
MAKPPHLFVALGAALALTAGAAQAQAQLQTPGASLRDAVFRSGAKASSAMLSSPAPAIGVAYAQAPPERPAGVATTAIDHSFDRKGVVGSVGFLCGLDSRLDNAGGMGAFGTDPQGRFVGAKLHLAFR